MGSKGEDCEAERESFPLPPFRFGFLPFCLRGKRRERRERGRETERERERETEADGRDEDDKDDFDNVSCAYRDGHLVREEDGAVQREVACGGWGGECGAGAREDGGAKVRFGGRWRGAPGGNGG